jgi:hypothetical protein
MLMTLRNALIGALVLGFTGTALAQDPEAGDVEPVEESGSLEESSTPGLSDEGSRAAKPISVGLLLGYGISLEEGNPWGLGFGLRGGYNIDAIFLGARFVYYLGESEEAGGFEASSNIWELGIEGGYDLAAGPVIIRPGVGLGLANFSVSAEFPDPFGTGTTTVDESEMYLYLALGCSVLYDIDDTFFIGGDLRFQIVMADESANALIILANGGMRF